MQLQDLAYRPASTHTSHFPAAATLATASVASPGVTKRHYIRGFTLSCNGESTTPITVTIFTGTTGIDKFYIPAAAFAPVLHNYTIPLVGDVNATVSIVTNAPSTGVSVGVILHTFSGD